MFKGRSYSRRCLLLSYVFAPSTGGIETVSGLLAQGLAERGYEVRVVTATAAGSTPAGHSQRPYQVYRQPGTLELWQHLRWSEVVLQSNFSLKQAWPLVCGALSRPWVLVHHTPLTRPSGQLTVRDRLKLASLGNAQCYSVSSYLAATIPVPSEVIFNPYDDALFRVLDGCRREQPLIFLGRLVPAKGLDVLLRSLALLKAQSVTPRLTIVGEGPAERSLRQLATSLDLDEQISFAGPRYGAELVRLLNEHQVLVVPSRTAPPEALGLVSIEGIACGCVVIASNQGGLPESIGPCGVTFETESVTDLARTIRELLESPRRQNELRAQRENFLRAFTRETILQQYDSALNRAIETFRLDPLAGASKPVRR